MTQLVHRVRLRNWRSIAACDVTLGGLTFLLGRNGAGKSNFLDAFQFVSDALNTSLDHAFRDRGGIGDVRRKSGGHPNHFAMRFDLTLPDGIQAAYSLRIGAKPSGGFVVQDERGELRGGPLFGGAVFHVKDGQVHETSAPSMPKLTDDRLSLVALSGIADFRPLFEALASSAVYSLNPRQIAAMQRPDPKELLQLDGSNAAGVLRRLTNGAPASLSEYLARIVPGITAVETQSIGPLEQVHFKQAMRGSRHEWSFPATSMSDGTLRAFGTILALLQASAHDGSRQARLIGLEEPEMALHPAAAAALLAAIREGARHAQVLVTSHSPELLDNPDISADQLLAVMNDDGQTHIGRLDAPTMTILRERLMTAGELLRQDQLEADPAAVRDVRHERQLRLFEPIRHRA